MNILTAIFLCLTLVAQTGLCLFYSKLSRRSWRVKKSEGLYYGLMTVLTLMSAVFCIFAMLDLAGLHL